MMLKKMVEKVTELGDIVAKEFACGGELATPEEVRLVYKSKDGSLRETVFPGTSDEDLQQLIEVCSIATSNHQSNTSELSARHFLTSFQIADTPILLDTTMTMAPDTQCIRAELYKLNIYSEGSFFKAHVDTPLSKEMFGSLVVCLPTVFTGGTLVTRHHGHEVKFDWSSLCDSPRKTISWAVFFSDVEHEVLPVSSGHRVILTFNLYSMGPSRDSAPYQLPLHDIIVNPFYKELRRVLSNPAFMRKGAVLGFASRHSYVYKDLNNAANLPVLLKGADRMVYSTAKSLGLSVIVKPVVKGGSKGSKNHMLPQFLDFVDMGELEEDYSLEEAFSVPVRSVKHITWCHDLNASHWEPLAAGFAETLEMYYHAAAILVGIPKWGEYRRNCFSCNLPKTARSPEKEQQQQTPPAKRSCLDGNNDSDLALQKLKLSFNVDDAHDLRMDVGSD